MAHTFDTKLRFTGATNPLTSNYTCGAGATVLVVSIVTAGSTNRAGGNPTFNGVAMSQADKLRKYSSSPETSCELFYLLNPPTGSAYQISIPNTGTATLYAVASTYKAQSGYTSALDQQNGATGLSANPSVSVTTTVNGDVIVGVLGDGYTSVPTARSGTILYEIDDGQYTDNAQYYLQASLGTWATSWTVTSDDWCVCIAAFKEVLLITPKSFSDSGGGSDAFINPYRAMPFADVGHGSELFQIVFKALGFSDVGHGADKFTVAHQHTTNWSDTLDDGTYRVTMPTSVTINDIPYTFGKWENESTNPIRDVALTADTTITATYEQAVTPKSFSDSGGGSDAFINPYRAMPFGDVGHGTEAFNTPFRSMGFADVGHGSELFQIVFKALGFADIGHGSDAFSLFLQKAFADAGYGTDAFTKIVTFLNKTFGDSGNGADGFINPFRAMGFSDVGHGNDIFNLLRFLVFSDVAHGTDNFAMLWRALGFSDVGHGTDIFTLLRALAFVDMGHGTDAFSIPLKGMAFSDVGHGSDAFATPFRAMLFTESGHGVDAFVIPFKALGFTDVAGGTDAFIKEILGAISKAFAETAAGSDSYAIPFKAMRFADVGTGTDAFATPFRAMIFTDTGHGVDVFIIPFKALGFADVGAGLDSYTKEILGAILKVFSDAGLGTDGFIKEILGAILKAEGADEGLPVLRVQKAFWSGLKVTGAVKQKTSSSVSLKGQLLHRESLSARLQGTVLQKSMLKAEIHAACLRAAGNKLGLSGCSLRNVRESTVLSGAVLNHVAFKGRLRGRNSALIALSLWTLLDDDVD